MKFSLFVHSSRFIASAIAPGGISYLASVRNNRVPIAINSAAGTPLPDTSPRQKYNISSMIRKS